MQGRLVAAAIAFAGICWSAPQAAPGAPPKLAVIIVVDQMRADYVDRFNDQWTGGLKRMVTQGAWFQQAAYPYLTTVTCAGHATIATGSFPHLHGIIRTRGGTAMRSGRRRARRIRRRAASATASR